jgi:hypothetical protein
MNKTEQIREAMAQFNDRTKAQFTDNGYYPYRAGYLETVVKALLLRVNDEDRQFVLEQLIGE